MVKSHTLTIVLFIMLSMVVPCSTVKKDIQINDTLDLSKVSLKLKIKDAYMTKDFGIYGEVENALGIILSAHVEKGIVHENSQMLFVDENGKVLYIDNLFKIEIVLKSTSSEYETKRQSFAESGDDALLYLKYMEDDVLTNNSKYLEILDLLRKSQFAVLK